MRKMSFILSLIAVMIAALGAGIAIGASLCRKKDEGCCCDDPDSFNDDDFDYYESQVDEDNEQLQEIVDDTHPQEHGAIDVH